MLGEISSPPQNLGNLLLLKHICRSYSFRLTSSWEEMRHLLHTVCSLMPLFLPVVLTITQAASLYVFGVSCSVGECIWSHLFAEIAGVFYTVYKYTYTSVYYNANTYCPIVTLGITKKICKYSNCFYITHTILFLLMQLYLLNHAERRRWPLRDKSVKHSCFMAVIIFYWIIGWACYR